jgi:phage baseplate assembly protein W
MQDTVRRAILFFEPRIDLERIDIDDTRIHEGLVTLHLFYTVRSTNSRSNMVYPFYFLEGTH